MCGDELDRVTGIRHDGNGDSAAPHHPEGGPVIIDLDGLKTRRKFQDFLRLSDWPPSKPSNANVTLIRVRGNSPVPSTPKEPNQVVERGWVANLLDGQSIRSLSVDRCCQGLNFCVVGGLG